MSDEDSERIVRGPKGEQGEQGKQGVRGLGMTPGARRGFVYLSILMVVLAGAILVITARQIDAANGRARAQCRFDADLGAAPVALSAQTGKPSLLAVSIVSDARVAWHQLGCSGHLSAPSASFMKWSVYYHRPAN